MDNIADDASGTNEYAQYQYIGSSMIGSISHPDVSGGLNLSYGASGAYGGWDRFNSLVDQRWLSGTTDKDRYQYGYDRDANRLYRENLLDAALSELYDYDGLNRVTTMERGTLDGTKTALTGSASRSQAWDLDALGNSDGVTTDGVNQARTHNAQNQLTQVGASNLSFDANGNLTTDQNGKTLRYDAWNRLVEQKNGATSEIVYQYDGLGRRISEGATEIFFTTNWQAIEERNASNQTTIQYVWSPVYVDAMILRDRDTNNNGTLDERLYIAQDANWNVTALISTSGAVLERFQYDAYGKRAVLDASWSPTTDVYSFQHGHQGGKIDAVTGRINFRNRDYDVNLMRWVQQDYKAGYVDGLNLYQYLRSNPAGFNDASGMNAARLQRDHSECERSVKDVCKVKDISPAFIVRCVAPQVELKCGSFTYCVTCTTGLDECKSNSCVPVCVGFDVLPGGTESAEIICSCKSC